MSKYDLIVKGGKVVFENYGPYCCDLGIKNGKIVAIQDHLSQTDSDEVVDATGLVVLPGSVDCHSHLGIYRPLDIDTQSETQSALVGGVTTLLSYFRTGQHYMNKTGPYQEILPQALAATSGNSYVDFGFHISPMSRDQVGEIGWLIDSGVTTFKYFMFYKGLNLSASSTDGQALTMSDSYDLGHLYTIMTEVEKQSQKFGDNTRLSVSVHCEDDELIKRFIDKVKMQGLQGLHAYCEARPPLSERVAIHKATAVASSTKASLNLLHLTSAEAIKAAQEARSMYPDCDIKVEVTLHALGLTYDMLEGKGLGGKVNPPIRTKSDSDALWDAVKKGHVDWVGSDHACTMSEMKGNELWSAACGFGGTSLMYPFMISEGFHKRGISLSRISQLVSTNPARSHACYPQKGHIAVGADADLAIVDLELEQEVKTDMLHSAQDYTPFEGMKLKGWPVRTILRGKTVYLNGAVVGTPGGQYLKRPL